MNTSIKVIDDVVSNGYQNNIEDMFSSFHWQFIDGVTYKNSEKDSNTGFTNSIYNSADQVRKPETDFLLPLLYEGIDKYDKGETFKEIYRIRAVMWVRNQNKRDHIPHCDLDFDHHTMVYYINDSDSPTRFYKYDKVFEEVQPKKGRAVIFPGHIKHSSASPIRTSRRMILNFNFLL